MKTIKYVFSLLIAVLFGVVLSISILPVITSFAAFQKVKPLEYDPIAMLTINVGLMQGLIGIMTIGIALIGVNTFKSVGDKVDNLTKDVQRHEKELTKKQNEIDLIKQEEINSQKDFNPTKSFKTDKIEE